MYVELGRKFRKIRTLSSVMGIWLPCADAAAVCAIFVSKPVSKFSQNVADL